MNKKTLNMISEYLVPGKLEIDSKVFFKYRNLRPVRNVLKKGLVFVSLVGLGFTTFEVGREIYEEVTTENKLVNIGPVLFKNKETRPPEVLYQDIENAILNMEGIERIFEGNLEKNEKHELIMKVIKTIADEANIKTDDYSAVDFFPISTAGAYTQFNFNVASLGIEYILIREDSLNYGAFHDVIEMVVHEMLHAVGFENNLLSKQLTDFDKKLFSINELMDSETYYSSFVETYVHLLTSRIMLKIVEKYYPTMPFNTFNKTKDVFKEIINNLYDINIKRPDVLSNLFNKSENVTHQVIATQNLTEDVNNYQSKTLGELLLLGYEKKLNDQNINYKNIDLTKTFYYKLGIYIIDEIKDVRYCDYYNSTYDIIIENVETNIQNFETKLDSLKEYKIAVQLAQYDSAIRYHKNDYSIEEINIMNETIEKHLNKLSEKNIIRFGFKERIQQLNIQNSESTSNFQTEITEDLQQ